MQSYVEHISIGVWHKVHTVCLRVGFYCMPFSPETTTYVRRAWREKPKKLAIREKRQQLQRWCPSTSSISFLRSTSPGRCAFSVEAKLPRVPVVLDRHRRRRCMHWDRSPDALDTTAGGVQPTVGMSRKGAV